MVVVGVDGDRASTTLRRSALLIAQSMRRRFDFEQPVVLLEDDATEKQVLAALEEQAGQLEPGATLVFVLGAHADVENEGRRQYVQVARAHQMERDTLALHLQRVVREGTNLLSVLEACNSQGLTLEAAMAGGDEDDPRVSMERRPERRRRVLEPFTFVPPRPDGDLDDAEDKDARSAWRFELAASVRWNAAILRARAELSADSVPRGALDEDRLRQPGSAGEFSVALDYRLRQSALPLDLRALFADLVVLLRTIQTPSLTQDVGWDVPLDRWLRPLLP